jgi:ppGpp synthetase/RelA/SpoT-type nucleotidyltranferase
MDFEQEKITFRAYYDDNRKHFLATKNAYIRIINSLVMKLKLDMVTKVEGRVKDREECIKKFHRKYQDKLEVDEQPYEIKAFISDMIGIRIVCMYEDQIAGLADILQKNFKILTVTDKIASMEGAEDSFGYKSLHMDLVLNDEMALLPQYQPFANCSFEVQIRSLIQDAWSVLDQQIKYKKSIPSALKRRINSLSALFEIAGREFMEIRNATAELIQQEKAPLENDLQEAFPENTEQGTTNGSKTVNAFNFLRIAGHFFRNFEFIDYKVDHFVHEILKLDKTLQKSDFHKCLTENFKIVREYRSQFLKDKTNQTFSPYASIRHCLFLYDPETFRRILTMGTKERFIGWLIQSQGNSD